MRTVSYRIRKRVLSPKKAVVLFFAFIMILFVYSKINSFQKWQSHTYNEKIKKLGAQKDILPDVTVKNLIAPPLSCPNLPYHAFLPLFLPSLALSCRVGEGFIVKEPLPLSRSSKDDYTDSKAPKRKLGGFAIQFVSN